MNFFLDEILYNSDMVMKTCDKVLPHLQGKKKLVCDTNGMVSQFSSDSQFKWNTQQCPLKYFNFFGRLILEMGLLYT